MKLKTLIGVSAFVIMATSCGWSPTSAQIKTMEDTRAAALKAEQTKNKKLQELNDLKAKVSQSQAKKAAAEAELKKVQDELARRGGQ